MRSDRTYFRTEGLSEHTLLTELADAYERGWQPVDLVHITARSGDASDVALAATAVLFDARVGRAAERAPTDWTRQLDEIGRQRPHLVRAAAFPDLAEGLRHACPHVTRYQVEGVAFTWKYLPSFALLTPPPSQWPSNRRAAGESAPAPDPRLLGRIRALLSKAESTDFPEEAEALTAKAQELVSRHAVGAALLTAPTSGTGPVAGRRLHLDGTYIKEKVLLLTAIGDANRVRTVWFTRVQIATIVGAVTDLQQVEMLFASLLVQATRAVQAAGTAGRRGASATSFRRAFLTGYAHRIGERLREADVRATAEAAADAHVPMTALAPILARRSDAVDTEFRRLFPVTRDSRSRGVDADGFHAGRDAADAASLGPERRSVPH
ncbi:DUF2786 domain-containing protein [Rhodococcus sp. Z13]|uniref:DUF2786 domain-containing protein n=1 Tax=Rhodococcus sacchari TaxID=2962047 RepID=A0ACD4DIJ3_9NOCA|nr:DUF2786 domain-containing protein [Rhodococcus sp. Z13]UYP19856.1 DUF2786 domain-containing protein [Rhodococcus sp. Z13]